MSKRAVRRQSFRQATNVQRMAEQSVIRVAGTSITPLAMNSSSGNFRYNVLPLNPQGINSSRLSSVSDAYLAYRFTFLRVTVYHETTPDTTPTGYAVGYDPVVPDNNPTSVYDIMEMMSNTWLSAQQTVPTSFVTIRKGMNGFLTKWLKTRTSASDNLFEYQGEIIYGCNNSTANPVLTLKFDWIVEFKDPAPTALTGRDRRDEVNLRVPRPLTVIQGWDQLGDDEKSPTPSQSARDAKPTGRGFQKPRG